MGISATPADLASKFRKTGENLSNVERSAVNAGGKVAKETMIAAAAIAGAGGRRGVTVKTQETSSNGHAAALVRWGPNPGWVKIMDSGAKAHFIGPRSGKGRARGSLRKQNTMRGSRRAMGMAVASLFGGTVGAGTHGAINIPGVGPRAWAHHPGTKGKHFVDVGNAAAIPRASKEVSKAAVVAFGKAFT